MPRIEVYFEDDEREYARDAYERIEAMLSYWGGVGTLSAEGLDDGLPTAADVRGLLK